MVAFVYNFVKDKLFVCDSSQTNDKTSHEVILESAGWSKKDCVGGYFTERGFAKLKSKSINEPLFGAALIRDNEATDRIESMYRKREYEQCPITKLMIQYQILIR